MRGGASLQLKLSLHSSSRKPQRLAIDYLVHHVKAKGSTSPKVFKGWTVDIASGEKRALEKNHSMKPITTRVYCPGAHRVQARVNSNIVAAASFTVTLWQRRKPRSLSAQYCSIPFNIRRGRLMRCSCNRMPGAVAACAAPT